MGGAVDFVVLGFGIGALAVLLGLALRNLGPWPRRIRQGQVLRWSEVTRRLAWGRACRAAGLVLAIAGGFLCFATLAALIARANDRTGALIVLFASALALLASVGWALVYARRQPRLVPVFTASPARPQTKPTVDLLTSSPPGRGRPKRGSAIDDLVPSHDVPSLSNGATLEVGTPPVFTHAVPSTGPLNEDAILPMEPVGPEPGPAEGDVAAVTVAAAPAQSEPDPQVDGETGATNGVSRSEGASDAATNEVPPKVVRPLAETHARTGMPAGFGAVSPSNRIR